MAPRGLYLLIKMPGGALRVPQDNFVPERFWESYESFPRAREAAEADADSAFILDPDGKVLWRAAWAG
jgi:hypothetical protein